MLKLISLSKNKEQFTLTREHLHDTLRLFKHVAKNEISEQDLNEFIDFNKGSKSINVVQISDYMEDEKSTPFDLTTLKFIKNEKDAMIRLFEQARSQTRSLDIETSSSFDGEVSTIIDRGASDQTDADLQVIYSGLKQVNSKFKFDNSEAHFIAPYMVSDKNDTGTFHCHPDHRELVLHYPPDDSSEMLIQASRQLSIRDLDPGLTIRHEFNKETGLWHNFISNTGEESVFVHVMFKAAGHAFSVHPHPNFSHPSIVGKESKMEFLSVHTNMVDEIDRVQTFTQEKNYAVDKHKMTAATVFLLTDEQIAETKSFMDKQNIAKTQLNIIDKQKFQEMRDICA